MHCPSLNNKPSWLYPADHKAAFEPKTCGGVLTTCVSACGICIRPSHEFCLHAQHLLCTHPCDVFMIF